MVLALQKHAYPMRILPVSNQPLLFFLLTSFLIAPGSPSSESTTLPVCPSATGLFHKAHAWGAGVEGKDIQLGEDTCFLLEARDKDGRKLNTQCSPPSLQWQVLITGRQQEVFLEGRVEHLATDGLFWVCYSLLLPGNYTVSVILLSSDAERVREGRKAGEADLPHLVVNKYHVTALADKLVDVQTARSLLPPCTPPLLSHQGNSGQWVRNLWHPDHCRVNRITPREIAECLGGKRVLVVGDSQLWSLFPDLLAYLGGRDRCHYRQEKEKGPGGRADMKCYALPKRNGGEEEEEEGAPPYLPGSHDIGFMETEWGRARVEYYGTKGNGYGLATFGWDNATSVHFTFVAHSGADSILFNKWMVDFRRAGLLAHVKAPYDWVLATTGVEEVGKFETAEDYAAALDLEFVPSLRFHTPNMSAITWAGMWALHEGKKEGKRRAATNSPKGEKFDDAAKSVMSEWGVTYLPLREMTSPRSDLLSNGLHSSWPVSLATIELWLGSICPPSKGWEPDSDRC